VARRSLDGRCRAVVAYDGYVGQLDVDFVTRRGDKLSRCQLLGPEFGCLPLRFSQEIVQTAELQFGCEAAVGKHVEARKRRGFKPSELRAAQTGPDPLHLTDPD
jgi:hypothetical protein